MKFFEGCPAEAFEGEDLGILTSVLRRDQEPFQRLYITWCKDLGFQMFPKLRGASELEFSFDYEYDLESGEFPWVSEVTTKRSLLREIDNAGS